MHNIPIHEANIIDTFVTILIKNLSFRSVKNGHKIHLFQASVKTMDNCSQL